MWKEMRKSIRPDPHLKALLQERLGLVCLPLYFFSRLWFCLCAQQHYWASTEHLGDYVALYQPLYCVPLVISTLSGSTFLLYHTYPQGIDTAGNPACSHYRLTFNIHHWSQSSLRKTKFQAWLQERARHPLPSPWKGWEGHQAQLIPAYLPVKPLHRRCPLSVDCCNDNSSLTFPPGYSQHHNHLKIFPSPCKERGIVPTFPSCGHLSKASSLS